ncbi:hypothetical protein [Microbacterium sp.]|uniref:hypothetical protein n=1 Tax=Microbacterium sp. TaxID=51671 RepID=UPI003A8EFEE2
MPELTAMMIGVTTFEQFRASMANDIARAALGIDMSGAEASRIAGDHALCRAYYENWTTANAGVPEGFSAHLTTADATVNQLARSRESPVALSRAVWELSEVEARAGLVKAIQRLRPPQPGPLTPGAQSSTQRTRATSERATSTDTGTSPVRLALFSLGLAALSFLVAAIGGAVGVAIGVGAGTTAGLGTIAFVMVLALGAAAFGVWFSFTSIRAATQPNLAEGRALPVVLGVVGGLLSLWAGASWLIGLVQALTT